MDSNFIFNIVARPGVFLTYLFNFIIIVFLIYIIIRSLLEIRQIKILQEKIKTPVDSTMNLLNIIYLIIQLIIFVIILIIM